MQKEGCSMAGSVLVAMLLSLKYVDVYGLLHRPNYTNFFFLIFKCLSWCDLWKLKIEEIFEYY